MATVVDLHVRNVDIDDDQVLARLDEIENVSFGSRRGLTVMTVYVNDGEDVVHTVTDAAHHLAVKVQGAFAVRVDPDLVTISDIGHRVGVSREAVRKWTLLERKPFPVPFASTEAQKLWRWVEIVEWLLAAKHIDMDEDLPEEDDIATIDACLAKVPDSISTEWAKLSSSPSFASTVESRPRRKAIVTHVSFKPQVRNLLEQADSNLGVENVG